MDIGANDYVTKPFDIRELLARMDGVLKRKRFYEKISMTDEVTGLYNIHFYKKQLSIFMNIAQRYKQSFSLAIIDVDNFKSINDTYGHTTGDRVLKKLANVLQYNLRKADIITRYGGDEFTVILPEINEREAQEIKERLKKDINDDLFVENNSDEKIYFSFSIGIATYSVETETELFELADTDMYRSKNSKIYISSLENVSD